VSGILDYCGCGEAPPPARRPLNRPGLSVISYRISRHSDFLSRMLDALARQSPDDPTAGGVLTRPLAALTTRSTDDPTIALIDAWACVLDVLTFYQERIANEGYLGTATERFSIRELAREIGYELAPGLAARTFLAFTVESADDPFRRVDVPGGTQVMSVPQKPGDLPQVFETLADGTTRADWNAIPSLLQRAQLLALYTPPGSTDPVLVLLDQDGSIDTSGVDSHSVFKATLNNSSQFLPLGSSVDVGALVRQRGNDTDTPADQASMTAVAVNEIHLSGIATGLSPGNRILAVGCNGAAVAVLPLLVRAVDVDTTYAVTRVTVDALGSTSGSPVPPPAPVRPSSDLVYVFPTLKFAQVTRTPTPLDRVSVSNVLEHSVWRASDMQAMLTVQKWSASLVSELWQQPAPAVAPPLGQAVPGIYALRQRLGFFGNSAPRQEMLAKADEERGGSSADPYGQSWDSPSGAASSPVSVWHDSQNKVIGATAHTFLERAVDPLPPDSWAVLEAPAVDADGNTIVRHLTLRMARAVTVSRTDFAISGKVSGLLFDNPDGTPFAAFNDNAHFGFRQSSIDIAGVPLDLAGLPIKDDVTAGTTELTLGQLVVDLLPGIAVAVSGNRSDAPAIQADEIAQVTDVQHVAGYTHLKFSDGLARSYVRASLTVNANVLPASHGETIQEVLGSGDAQTANQAFALKKPPLTYLSAVQAPYRVSTLTVRVNGMAWQEVPTLYTAGAHDPVFIVRIDEDGTTRVVFGDAVRGARLPTGQFNVIATYRAGIGTVGEVPDGSLINLRSRPLGIRSVVNPDAASGSADAETLQNARTNAPATVRTLDRIVSLTDYEDVARTFPGFGKARASLLWRGNDRLVHVTVGTATGATPPDADPSLTTLRDAMEGMRDPFLPLVVQGYAPVPFDIAATVGVDDRYVASDVQAAVATALGAAFGYAARDFAAPVTGAGILAAMQAVTGVVYATLASVVRTDEPGTIQVGYSALLPAAAAAIDPNAGAVTPAELLLINPAGIGLTTEMVHVG
jgi:hypothetical protein